MNPTRIRRIAAPIAIAAIACTAALAWAAGAGKLIITVVDADTGKGISGAQVTVEGAGLSGNAGGSGEVVLANVPAGSHTVRCSANGYSSSSAAGVKVADGGVSRVRCALKNIAIAKKQAEERARIEAERRLRPAAEEAAERAPRALMAPPAPPRKTRRRPSKRPRAKVKRKPAAAGMPMPSRPARIAADMPARPQGNTEEYATIDEAGFKSALQNPLSTFSIDVDTASYANARRFIEQQNRLPPKDAVRIEEFINYFDYDYANPKGEHPFSINTEISEAPWHPERRLVHIGIQGQKVDYAKMPPSNLVFLLDVSGSMNRANKLPLLKQAFRMLVRNLRPTDRVAIVVYAGAAGLVLPSTSGEYQDQIIAALDNLRAGGSTAGGAGIKLAYQVAQDHFIKGGNNRIILATDGDFNVGTSSTGELTRLVEEKRKSGVFLTILGFGSGNYKDSRMEELSNKGNGNAAYIDSVLEAKKVMVTEMGGTLLTIAKDVKIQVDFNPAKVKGYRLIGYENRALADRDFNDDTKDAGELGAGHTVTVLYEIIPADSAEGLPGVPASKYQDRTVSDAAKRSPELMTVKLRYKQPDGDKSTLVEQPIVDARTPLAQTSENFRFSAAVAAFGMVLRESKFKGTSTLPGIIEMAKAALGADKEGYRSGFVQLVRKVEAIGLAR